jgi:ribosomal protein S18 acetylase RimI-like enzyme
MAAGILIRPLAESEAAAAKSLITSVVAVVYHWTGTLEALVQDLDGRNVLNDMADITRHYTARGGLFLGAFDQERLVGTGAVWPLAEDRCELKRMWLLPEYWGRGIGYAVIQRLFAHARQQDWQSMFLCTDHVQERAVNFYHRLGFTDTKERQEKCGEDELSMVLSLEP